MPDNAPHNALRHHVSGAIARGEAEPIIEQQRYVKPLHVYDDSPCTMPDNNTVSGCHHGMAIYEGWSYVGEQLARIGNADTYSIKLKSLRDDLSGRATNWMNITPDQLNRIATILSENRV